jgi:site-specific DNA recombinase
LTSVRVNRGSVDQVLFVKWDRFSRNATDALGMIRTLEDLGIDAQVVEQPIDRAVPEQLMMLAIYVAAPEVENRRRSLSTKQGMRRAMKEGRWTTTPPKGYKRTLDDNGKSIIVPGDDADYVREAFRLAAHSDLAMEQIRKKLCGRGFRCSANQFTLLLRNPVYKGKIFIPAWKSEGEQLVEGIHEGLVDEVTWHRAQQRFERKHRGSIRAVRPELELRGFLECPRCGRILSGSCSKGRNDKYWYYHCTKGCKERHRTEEVHEALEEWLTSIEAKAPVLAPYEALLLSPAREEGKSQTFRLRALRAEEERLDNRILAADERFLDGDLPADAYNRFGSNTPAN